MTQDHIDILRHVEKNQPIQDWTPENWNVANELISSGFIRTEPRVGQPMAWGNREMPIRKATLDLSAREKMKEWQDALDENKLSYRMVSAFKKTSTIIGTGVGFVVGGFLGVLGSEAAHTLIDQMLSKETKPIQQGKSSPEANKSTQPVE